MVETPAVETTEAPAEMPWIHTATPPEGMAPAAWRAHMDAEADRLLEEVADLQADLAHAKAVAEERMQPIMEWLDGKRAAAERAIAEREARVEAYLRFLQAQDPKKKTLELPHGKRQLRAAPPQFEWPAPGSDEEAALLAWATAEDLVRVKTELDKTGIKAHHKDTGEIPPGVEVRAGGLSYTGGAK